MLILILAGIWFSVTLDSIPLSIITASLVLFRAQRPSRFGQRLRDAWYAREVEKVGAEDVR